MPIILSNRLRAMQEAAENFGDSVVGIRAAQKKAAQDALNEQRAAAQEQRTQEAHDVAMARQKTARGLEDMQFGQAKAQQAAGLQAQGIASELEGFGNAAPDQAIGLPGFAAQASGPSPLVTDAGEGLKDRLRASMHNAGLRAEGKNIGFITAEDIKKKRAAESLTREEAVFDVGEKKSKSRRDEAKSAQDIRESKAREANYYAGAEKDKKAAATAKQPNKEQFDAAGFGRRMEQAGMVFANLESAGYNRASKSAGIGAMMPNIAKTTESQQQDQAERNFINATLRRESGAAISPSEFENAEKQYFPRAGDSPEVIKQKRENRAQIMESMRAASGNAWDLVKPMGSKAMTVGKYSIEVED